MPRKKPVVKWGGDITHDREGKERPNFNKGERIGGSTLFETVVNLGKLRVQPPVIIEPPPKSRKKLKSNQNTIARRRYSGVVGGGGQAHRVNRVWSLLKSR